MLSFVLNLLLTQLTDLRSLSWLRNIFLYNNVPIPASGVGFDLPV